MLLYKREKKKKKRDKIHSERLLPKAKYPELDLPWYLISEGGEAAKAASLSSILVCSCPGKVFDYVDNALYFKVASISLIVHSSKHGGPGA